MCGLPARGKTYIARRLSRYLAWMGVQTRWYNVGNYRRFLVGSDKTHEWFNPTNEEANRLREECAQYVLGLMINDLTTSSVEVAVFDATNTTHARRALIQERCRDAGIETMFVESICNDLEIIASNIRETKLRSPDYVGADPDEAVRDFMQRIHHYEKVYETVTEDDMCYMKYIDVGRQVVMNRIHGYLPSRICYFITHLHTRLRPIYLVRHGESEYNTLGLIGGDSNLSERGREFGRRLSRFMQLRHAQDLVVFTSTLLRTRETAQYQGRDAVQWAALDELNAGICDSMTYEAIQEAFPAEWEARLKDKLRYRYPRGESYEDVIDRLETVIFELERLDKPVLVIGHQAVNRCLLAYFRNKPVDEVPTLEVPLHTVIELKPVAYGCEEIQYYLDRDDVENIQPRVLSAVPTNQPPPPDPPSC